MYSLDDLKRQNRDITQLLEVLSVLIEQRSLHDNPYVCELMARFKEKVWMHLVFEDNTLYAELARHNDPEVAAAAQTFHDSARAIKKRFSGYIRHWCATPATSESQHVAMEEESREMFRLVRERVDYENEQIFPLVESRL